MGVAKQRTHRSVRQNLALDSRAIAEHFRKSAGTTPEYLSQDLTLGSALVHSYRADLFQEFLPGAVRNSPVSIVSLSPCRRHYPAGVFYLFSQSAIAHLVFTRIEAARPPATNLSLTRLAQRSLMLQPGNSLISPRLTLSVGFSISITLHTATQARRFLALTAAGLLPPKMRVTLWITTAIHLDTLKIQDLTPDPPANSRVCDRLAD